MVTYLFLFFAKLIENTISTLRIIVVNRGQKKLGAILNFIVALIWAVSTKIIVTSFDNPINIFAFAMGCFVGSYLGSLMEENLKYH